MAPDYSRCSGCGAQLGVNGGWHFGNCPYAFRLDTPPGVTGETFDPKGNT